MASADTKNDIDPKTVKLLSGADLEHKFESLTVRPINTLS
jgi:hypothetical protein